jgi:hypothetical protein
MGIEEGNRRPLRKMLRPVQKRVVAPYRLGFNDHIAYRLTHRWRPLRGSRVG